MSDQAESQTRKKIGKPVAWGVLAFLLLQYAFGLSQLASRTGGMESKFSQLAVEEYRSYLIGQNLLVLAAYAIIGVVVWLLVMPAVSFVRGKRNWPGWVLAFLAFVTSLLIHGFFMFRLVHARPYFTADTAFGDWYYRVLDLPPLAWQAAINVVLFVWLPWMVAAAVFVWWWRHCGKRLRLGMVLLLIGGLVMVFWKPAPAHSVPVVSGGGRPMNIIIIGSDSLRGDKLGFSGYRPERMVEGGVSPTIDAWANEATIFEECRTPIGSTLESNISMMASIYPHTHGIRQMYPPREEVLVMEEKVEPLAALLAEKGYDTAAIGDWCAGFYQVTQLGFEDIDVSNFDNFQIYMSQAVFLAHFVVPLYFDNALGYLMFPQIRSFAQFVTPEVVTGRVEDRLVRQAASGKPFFWHVFYSCNHLPYRAAEPYCRMFSDPDYEGKNATGVDFDIDGFIGGTDLEDKWSVLPKPEAEQIRALYDGCTRQFDECFRRILDQLEAQGLAENTIVVLTADHGDDLYEQGVTLGHGLSFNGGDSSYHVPLVIRMPGAEPERIGEQVRTIDLAPTLAELVGLARPASWEGHSLAKWIEGSGEAYDLPYYGETQFPFIQFRVDGVERPELPPMDELTYIDPNFNHQFVLRPEFKEPLIAAKQRCLRTRDWKLVMTPGVDGKRHFGLFRTSDDPNCRSDLLDERPEIARPMREALERWLDEHQETPIREIFPDGE